MHPMSTFTLKKSAVALVVTSLLTITACGGSSNNNDTPAAPQNGPLSLSMGADEDTTAGELAGALTISPAADESDVAEYKLYWGSDDCAKVGTDPITSMSATGENVVYTFAEDTEIPAGADKLLVFTSNSGGEMADCLDMDITDDGFTALTVQADGVTFTDTDDGAGEAAGDIVIDAVTDESGIAGYALYWGSDTTTKLTQIGADKPKAAGNITHTLAADTEIPSGATHILAYTYSGTGATRQLSNNPRSALIVEVDAPTVNSGAVAFTDDDTDGGEISGDLAIAIGVETTITHYNIYWGADSTTKLSQTAIASIAKTGSALTHTFAANTALPAGATHLLVHTMNANGEDTDGIHVAIVDDGLPKSDARGINFTDTDLNSAELGGTVTVTAALDESDITHYVLYWADSSDEKLFDMAITSLETNGGNDVVYVMPINTMIPAGATKIGVFSKNDDGEKLTGVFGAATNVTATPAAPTSVAFTDGDGTEDEVSGNVTFSAPATQDPVITSYKVHFLNASDAKVGAAIISGAASPLAIPADTAIPATATKLGVYSTNAAGEDSVVATVALTDIDAVAAVDSGAVTAPTDLDTNTGQAQGAVTFVKATNEATISSYELYWAKTDNSKVDADAFIVSIPKTGANLSHTLLENTAIPTDAAKFLVLTKNIVGEQTTAGVVSGAFTDVISGGAP